MKQDHANEFEIAYPLFGAWGLAVVHSKAHDASMSRKTVILSLGYSKNVEHTRPLKFHQCAY